MLTKRPQVHYAKKTSTRCVWCDEVFECCHGERAQTCSGRCRSNLARYRKLTGLDPERPPGKVTAHTAYKDLIGELLARERQRRAYTALIAQQEGEQIHKQAVGAGVYGKRL